MPWYLKAGLAYGRTQVLVFEKDIDWGAWGNLTVTAGSKENTTNELPTTANFENLLRYHFIHGSGIYKLLFVDLSNIHLKFRLSSVLQFSLRSSDAYPRRHFFIPF